MYELTHVHCWWSAFSTVALDTEDQSHYSATKIKYTAIRWWMNYSIFYTFLRITTEASAGRVPFSCAACLSLDECTIKNKKLRTVVIKDYMPLSFAVANSLIYFSISAHYSKINRRSPFSYWIVRQYYSRTEPSCVNRQSAINEKNLKNSFRSNDY